MTSRKHATAERTVLLITMTENLVEAVNSQKQFLSQSGKGTTSDDQGLLNPLLQEYPNRRTCVSSAPNVVSEFLSKTHRTIARRNEL